MIEEEYQEDENQIGTQILTEAELNYLRSLKKDITWINIIEKLSTFSAPPLFTPASRDQKDQYDRWVYESGVLKEVKGLIAILNGRETQLIVREDKNE